MPSSLTKKEEAQQQQVRQHQHAHDAETQEHHASANASAGLNLNLAGALAGAFSSTSKKTTHQNPDGSADSVEDRHDQGAAHANAQGQGGAYAAGNAEEHSLKRRERGAGQDAELTEGKAKKKEVDHLGIEA